MAKKETTNDNTTPATAGVVLFAFGKRGYYWAAYNLAFSIKSFNPNLSITLFVDSYVASTSSCDLHRFIDDIVEIDNSDLYTENKFDPGKLKVSLYKYLPYDHNLYLDVDAVALKDITPLLDELIETGRPYISHCVGYHTIDQGRAIPSMQWAWADDIWERYKLDDKSVLPAINSSLQFISKGKEAEKLYDTAKDLYLNNQIPTEKLRMKWGGGQPDELYMNIALCMNGIDPSYKNEGRIKGSESGFIHFAMQRGLSYQEVTANFYLQSYYGGAGFTPRFYTEWLDRLLKINMRKLNLHHEFTIVRITEQKHADAKR